jgi:hypothetical protein
VQVAETLYASGDFDVLSAPGQASVYDVAPAELRPELWRRMGPDAQALAKEGKP